MIRLLLAEDQAMMRGALAVLLGLEPDLEVVAEVRSGTEIVPRALETRPDVALLDIELPGRNGFDAAADLARELPGCAVSCSPRSPAPGYVQRAMAAGARGFLAKDGPVESLAEASAPSSPAVPSWTRTWPAMRCGRRPSTHRSGTRVLAEAEDGSTITDIASRLHLTPAPCATTCPAPSARPAPATRSRPRCSPAATGGSRG